MKLDDISDYKTRIKSFEQQIKSKYPLKTFSVFEYPDKIILNMIEVPKDSRKQGIGTQVMQELIDYADKYHKRIILTTGMRDDIHGTTSSSRLKKFYKRFGFVENKGRNKDYSISGNMYRDPKR